MQHHEVVKINLFNAAYTNCFGCCCFLSSSTCSTAEALIDLYHQSKKTAFTGQYHLTKKIKDMKKLITILTAIVLLFSATAFAAAGEKVTAKVKVAFEKDFQKAENVSWQNIKDIYFASFTMNDVIVNAAYNADGELVATSRKIAAAQLPLTISLALSKKYSDYTLQEDATEISFNDETHYFVMVANTKQTLRLNCSTNGELTIDKRVKK